MATRCFISVLNNDKYSQIYSHNDGYLEGVGNTLFNYYNTIERVNELMKIGDISYLTYRISSDEVMQNNDDSFTFAYGRDRNEKGTECKIYDTEEQLKFEEYAYLFKDGKWFYRTWEDAEYKELTKDLT